MASIYAGIVFAGLCLLLCLPGLRRAGARRYIFLGTLFVGLDMLSLEIRDLFPALPPLPGFYNWDGKLAEFFLGVLAAALLIRFGSWNRKELGLRLTFNPGTWRDVLRFVLPVILIECVALWFMVPASKPTLEDHFFQLTMPGLGEELVYRGVLLALLDRAFPARKRILGADLGWATVVTSILFGALHGLDVNAHFHITMGWPPVIIPLLGGFVLAWARARSGSLLLPILLHSGMNEVANLIGWSKLGLSKTAR